VYDVLGRVVAVLAEGEYQAGHYTVRFDAGTLPEGIYFYELCTPTTREMKKMLLVR
jgi:hypothetical protein